MTSQAAHAIALQGLVKSFRGPGGPVRAVRAVDLSIARGFAARGKTVVFATHYLEEADA